VVLCEWLPGFPVLLVPSTLLALASCPGSAGDEEEMAWPIMSQQTGGLMVPCPTALGSTVGRTCGLGAARRGVLVGEGHRQTGGGSSAFTVRSHKKSNSENLHMQMYQLLKASTPDMFLPQSFLQPWAEPNQGHWTRGAGHTEHGGVCGVTSIHSSCCTLRAPVGLLSCGRQGWGVQGVVVPAGDWPWAIDCPPRSSPLQAFTRRPSPW